MMIIKFMKYIWSVRFAMNAAKATPRVRVQQRQLPKAEHFPGLG